jgi:heme-degrading monooxygenase HmoA
MFTIGLGYEVIEGKQADFEAGFERMQRLMQLSPGHQHSRLYRDVAGRCTYLIVSQWKTQALYESFIGSPQFRGIVDWARAGIVASKPTQMRIQPETTRELTAAPTR